MVKLYRQREHVGWFILLVLFMLAVRPTTSGRPAVNSLSYYETLNYDPSTLAVQHVRVSRAARVVQGKPFSAGHIDFTLTAFNRTFKSSLRHSKTLFTSSVQFLVNGKETAEYDPLTFYEGPLHGEEEFIVSGHIMDGVFDGVIRSKAGKYHVERAHKFFDENSAADFHSIIYYERDVLFPSSPATCGVKGKIMENMKKVSSHAVPLVEPPVYYGKDEHTILRRQIATNKFCQVRVVADHLFLANEGGGSVANTMSEMATIMNSVGAIYRNTDFNGDGRADGVQPVVAKLEVFESDMPGYRFLRNTITVEDFLDLWSQEDQSKFCLALLLTHRDFAGGVLGLAWVAATTGGNSGGICEQIVRLGVGERYLNTGIVTTLNFGQRQPRSVTEVTVAHEFGHNFGSPHDPAGQCAPGGSGGNYIMFAQATDGALSNNKLFSPCSISSINAVLNDKSSCFTASTDFCGNGVVENDEQCDCGTNCASDPCCNGNNCTLTTGSQCSSSEVCCTTGCMFTNNGTQCRSATECGEATLCNGMSGSCPSPVERAGVFLCNNNRSTCINGICAGSLCIARDFTDCQCEQGEAEESELCDVCCMGGANTAPCQSSFKLLGDGERLRSGRSCNNFQGYCSNSNPPKCVFVDNDRTLNDLLDFFTIATLNRIVAWLRVYWYIPVGVIVGLIIVFILLQVTYRRRKPIKRRLSQMRRGSTRGPGTVADPQTGGVGRAGRQAQERQRNREISQREAEQRLSRFFPTADRETMVVIMRTVGSESKAVKRLLDLGYPFKKLPLPRS